MESNRVEEEMEVGQEKEREGGRVECEECETNLEQRKVHDINVFHSEIAGFLKQHKPVASGRLSHTLFTGGAYFLPDTKREVLWEKLAKAWMDGTMPAIQEIHTLKFPMYIDMDMTTSMQHISKEAIRHMAVVMNTQVKKFFPEQNEVRLLICTKTKGGVLLDDGLYKQGIHFHWPDIFVVVDNAMVIRNGIIVALKGTGADSTLDWLTDIGMKDPPWDTIIDEAVYRPHDRVERSGGLRLIGAPKAKKCTQCPRAIGDKKKPFDDPIYDPEPMCDVCQKKNKKYIIDDNVYLLSDVFINDKPDEQQCSAICNNMKRMFRLTTVRAKDDQAETPGFSLFDTQPPQPGGGHKSGKAKVVAKSNSEDKVDGRKFAQFKEITDPEIGKIMRTLLIRHSEKYRDSKIKVLFDGKYTYRVLLTGEGARFCKNKGDYHSQNNVYMEIFKKTDSPFDFSSVMKCWSTKPVVYYPSCQTCKCFASIPVRLYREQAERLFKKEPTMEYVNAPWFGENDAKRRKF